MQNKKKRYILKIKRLDADGKVLNLHCMPQMSFQNCLLLPSRNFKKSQLSFIASCGTIFSTSCAIPEAIINTLVYKDISTFEILGEDEKKKQK